MYAVNSTYRIFVHIVLDLFISPPLLLRLQCLLGAKLVLSIGCPASLPQDLIRNALLPFGRCLCPERIVSLFDGVDVLEIWRDF